MASARLPPLGLPITSTVWRRHFERVCQEHSDVQQAYDTARFCEVEFAADDLGTLRIRCERTFTPLRWVVRHSSHGDLIMLVDDTGSSESVDVGRYAFDFPDRKEHLGPELFSQHMAVSASGGLYFARQGDFTAAVILPPTVRALAGLACDPRASDRRRSVENTMRLIQLAELWAFAHPTGNLLSRLRQHQVLRGLTRELFLLLGGATWGRAERLRLEGEARLRALARAVPSGRRESRLGLAIGRDAMNLVSVTNRQRVTFLASVATRILGLSAPAGTVVWERAGVRLVRKRPEHPEWLCEFALRLASAPHNAPSWAGTDVATGVSQLLALPVLARAARLLVLAVEHHTDEEPRAIGTSRLYAGWEWT